MATNPKRHVSLLFLSTLLAVFSLGSIISFTNPDSDSWLTLSFFYLSLFLTCLGPLTLIGLGLRQWLDSKLYIVNLGHSFRQAVSLSLLVVISFILLSKHILFWWVELSLVLLFAAFEAFLNLKI